jgi:molybdenum cofactor cytidylyltransferase
MRDESVRIAAVVLAAGASARLGEPKQALRFRGRPLLERAARAALDAGCRPVVVVTGAHAVRARDALQGLDVLEVENAQWSAGMGSSVRAGVAAVLGAAPEAAAVVLTVCDQPFMTASVLADLIAAHRETGAPVVASSYGGTVGVPALFARTLFDELAGLDAGAGAKAVISSHSAEARFVPFPMGEADVDTPADLARLAESHTDE